MKKTVVIKYINISLLQKRRRKKMFTKMLQDQIPVSEEVKFLTISFLLLIFVCFITQKNEYAIIRTLT